MGFTWVTSFMQAGPRFVESRRFLRRMMGPGSISNYIPLIETETRELLLKANDYRGDPFLPVMRYAKSFYITLHDICSEDIRRCSTMGAVMVKLS